MSEGPAGKEHEIQQAIERAKKEWEATFDSISDPLILTDLQGNITRMNRATIGTLKNRFRSKMPAAANVS
jgi:PAS domain-containing protein